MTGLTSCEPGLFPLTTINHELEAFSYSVSHDLRGPLVAFDATAIANLEKMRDASARMTSVFDGLQMLFRLTSGEIHREQLDISAMAAKVTEIEADPIVRRLPTPAQPQRVPGRRHRAGHGPANRQPPRRPDLG